MPKVPRSAKKRITRKCPICERKYISREALVTHIGNEHKELIPEDWTPSRYENYLRSNKTEGTCVECGKPTKWNDSTWKYNRYCEDKKCKESAAKKASKNMVKKYGKTTLLNDPEQQRKMIYSKKTSGIYYWSDDTFKKYKMYYASTVEKSFLEMLDAFLDLDPSDVFSPSPNTYTYQYNKENHFYIPDVYIASIDLEIELKEPKNNQNMHPKIQAVDKVKEKLKDELMDSLPNVNYIKVNGTDYSEFFEYFAYLKQNADDYAPAPVMQGEVYELKATTESCDEDDDETLESILDEINQEPVTERSGADDYLDALGRALRLNSEVIDPSYNYDRSISKIKKDIDNCNSMKGLQLIRRDIVSLRNELKRIISRNEPPKGGVAKLQKDSNKVYEAKIALEQLELLSNKLDIKMREVKKRGGSDIVLQESLITGTRAEFRYKPIYVVLSYTGTTMAKLIKGFTQGTYSHSSLALDTNLKKMCSFNAHGFVDEDITAKEFSNPEGRYAIYMYLAPEHEYTVIETIINDFITKRDHLKYSIVGLLNYIQKKQTTFDNQWFCSEFVSYVLYQANPKLLKHHYSLYSPDDLTSTRKLIKLEAGKTMDYDYTRIDKKVKSVMKRKGFEDVQIN